MKLSAKEADQMLAKQTPTPGLLTDPPEWLSDEQKAEWLYSIENAPREVLRRIDKGLLASYIIAQDVHRQACLTMRKVQRDAKTVMAELPSKYVGIINRQALVMARLAGELGFSPCSRARIDSSKPTVRATGAWEEVAKAG